MNADAALRLIQSPHNYEANGLKLIDIQGTLDTTSIGSLISIGSGLPDGDNDGLIYIRTDGTAEDTRLYLRGDPAASDWEPVLGGT